MKRLKRKDVVRKIHGLSCKVKRRNSHLLTWENMRLCAAGTNDTKAGRPFTALDKKEEAGNIKDEKNNNQHGRHRCMQPSGARIISRRIGKKREESITKRRVRVLLFPNGNL